MAGHDGDMSERPADVPSDDSTDLPTMNGALTGQLILATPKLTDPHFRRAVVLLLDHDEDGALGVVLNRPTDTSVHDVLPGWIDLVSHPDVIFSGGPVSTDSALGVASVRDLSAVHETPLGWRRLYERTGLVDLDTPPALLEEALAGLRIYAGYAGWGTGQLEAEIEEGAWYVVSSQPLDVFDADPEDMWRRVLRRQPGNLAFVASYPDDPAMN
jgi:putative transcriptional regulator